MLWPASPAELDCWLNGDRTPTVLVGVLIWDGFPPVNVESAGEMVEPALAQAVDSRVAEAE